MGQLIDGKALAATSREETASVVARLATEGLVPGLAVVLVGDDPASQVYVRNKAKACEKAGIASQQHTLPASTTEAELLQLVDQLNHDNKVHGILVQLPLPKQIHQDTVLAAIDPAKDVDGFHPINVGRLMLGLPAPHPCTPAGIMRMLESQHVAPAGKHAVVIGRSAIVGKPMALLLLNADATVTICHSRTTDVSALVRQADIVIAAVGRAHFVQGDWIKAGATVIDVGINRTTEGKLIGDVDTEAALERAAYVTPVPGGVGPMTIAMLLENTVRLATAQH